MGKFSLEELLYRINNSHTEVILRFLDDVPMISFSRSSIQLYIYSENIMLVKSSSLECIALEGFLHPDRFIGEPIPAFGDYKELIGLPKDSLTFHQYYSLSHECCLSVVTGQLDQLWHILQKSYGSE